MAVLNIMLRRIVRETIQSMDNNFRSPGVTPEGPPLRLLLKFWMAASTSSGVKGSSVIGICGHSVNKVGLICSTPAGFRRLSKCLLNSSSAGFSLVVSFSDMAPFQFIACQIFLGSFSFAVYAH